MTLDQLIEQLEVLRDGLGGDTLVIVSKDAEGNGFGPLEEAEIAMYAAENDYSGERYSTEEERQAEPNPDDYDPAPDDAVRAVFLWPTN